MAKAQKSKLRLAGVAEAADIIGISKSALSERRRRRPDRVPKGDLLPPDFPAPIVELHCGPIWYRDDVVAYRREVKRRARMTWWGRYQADCRAEKRREADSARAEHRSGE